MQKAYKNGFLSGLREYCNFKTGYSQGLTHQKKNEFCPKMSQFLQGYESGERFSEIQALEKDLEQKIVNVQMKLNKEERTISGKESSGSQIDKP